MVVFIAIISVILFIFYFRDLKKKSYNNKENGNNCNDEWIIIIILLSIIPLGRFKKLVNVKDIASINIRKR